MTETKQHIHEALQQFAESVASKLKALAPGQPEDQLRGPLETFLSDIGRALALKIIVKGESRLPGRLGRPDYAVLASNLLAGYLELKEPGKGADPNRYKGHDRKQWERFKSLPNIIYTDGNEWGLYRDGERIGPIVRLSGDIATSGKSAVKPADVEALKPLLTSFFSWEPTQVKDAKSLAELLAPLCRMLRQDVIDALKDANSPLVQLAGEWRQLLFPDADDERFADAYAQTVTFALLLARAEGASTIDLHGPAEKLAADHALLSRTLQEMTDPRVQAEIAPSLRLLGRVIDRVPQEALTRDRKSDPWLYFYEDFLAAYDPKLRKDAGAYYTPVEVVHAQVRLIDRLLVDRLHQPMGFSEPSVITLDPAVGTGTYLLGVIDHAMQRIAEKQGAGAVPAHATQMGQNIFGFEIMVGPYAVAQLRVSRALMDCGATLPKDGPGVYLTDTLESPHAQPPQHVMGWAQREMAEQHQKATKVKKTVPVLVCLGNPPYDRHKATDATDPGNLARTGGWVRYGAPPDHRQSAEEFQRKKSKTRAKPKTAETVSEEILRWRQKESILYKAFVRPALDAGHGGDVKNLYNLYVYFWRWALWKVFEHTTATGPGVVSYISASSYIDGDAFAGMREHMRRVCDEIWIIDLGGEGRGTRKNDNVFAIQTPVAIAIAVCYDKLNRDKPAKVHYTRIEGTRDQKLAKLEAITDFADLRSERCPNDWHAPFRPAGKGDYFDSPLLTDLMPWQHSGVECKRTWPIAPDEDTLKRRWRALLKADDRALSFRETGDRQITGRYSVALTAKASSKPITDLPSNAPVPPILACGFRSFDRQYIIGDGRLMSRARPDLWQVHGNRQVYLVSSLALAIGGGPAVTVAFAIPDRHYFAGRGGKDIAPVYRDAAAKHPNIVPGLLELFVQTYGRKVSPKDFLAYLYGILGQPAFTEQFEKELETRELRVPMTKDAGLFEQVAEVGRRLLWLHTYGQRFSGKGRRKGRVPRGAARCTKPVSDRPDKYPESFDYEPATKTLRIGKGCFQPVRPEVYEFEVSGLKVVQSWLGYRMRSGKGRKSSPLDDIRPERWTAQFTTELLELLWILEATLATYPSQSKLLADVLESELFKSEDLPPVPDYMRKPDRATRPLLTE